MGLSGCGLDEEHPGRQAGTGQRPVASSQRTTFERETDVAGAWKGSLMRPERQAEPDARLPDHSCALPLPSHFPGPLQSTLGTLQNALFMVKLHVINPLPNILLWFPIAQRIIECHPNSLLWRRGLPRLPQLQTFLIYLPFRTLIPSQTNVQPLLSSLTHKLCSSGLLLMLFPLLGCLPFSSLHDAQLFPQSSTSPFGAFSDNYQNGISLPLSHGNIPHRLFNPLNFYLFTIFPVVIFF